MKTLFAASEVVPFYKTGGLGDVAGALPNALNKQGDDVRVVAPFYHDIFPDEYRDQLMDLRWFTVWINHHEEYAGVKTMRLNGVIYYFIDNRSYFSGKKLYDHWNDGERFAFFQLAVIEMMQEIDFIPDVLHVNDWHTSMIPALLKTCYNWQQPLANIKTLLTIHNMQFQGAYAADTLQTFFDVDWNMYSSGEARFGDGSNWLKTGMVFADRINTVSPTYAEEIKTAEFGERLDPILRLYEDKLSGIVNGVDTDRYNPETDPDVPVKFSRDDLSGKEADKQALREEFSLPDAAGPLMVMVSRLTPQKGVHLLAEALPYFMATHDAQIIILGTGIPELEGQLTHLAAQYPTQLRVIIDFDVHLAQRLYAGADMFLMPSAFEPCGISQMMAQLYGTLPLVHQVGGLCDTVEPYNEVTGEGNGFGFKQFDAGTLGWMMDYAQQTFLHKPAVWRQLQEQAMGVDVSWTRSAEAYHALYEQL